MAEPQRTTPDADDRGNITPAPDETAEEERERVRSSNDADQARQRAGLPTPHDTYDAVVSGAGGGSRTGNASKVDWDGDGRTDESD